MRMLLTILIDRNISSFVNIAPAFSTFQYCKWFFPIQTLNEDIFPHWFDIAKFMKYYSCIGSSLWNWSKIEKCIFKWLIRIFSPFNCELIKKYHIINQIQITNTNRKRKKSKVERLQKKSILSKISHFALSTFTDSTFVERFCSA